MGIFLTGFDAKTLNTIYADKALRFHGLVQAFSRTNRILGETKPFGNVVCFRDLKAHTDEAIALFGNRDALVTVIVAPYAAMLERHAEAVASLLALTPTPDAVDHLPDEDAQAEFAKAFREVIRIRQQLESHSEFKAADLTLPEQAYADFTSKYLDLAAAQASSRDDEDQGPLDAIDFELELLQRDEINVAYIVALIATLSAVAHAEGAGSRRAKAAVRRIHEILRDQPQLHDKREIIEAFMAEELPSLDPDDVRPAFARFWDARRDQAFGELCAVQEVDPARLDALMRDMHFRGKEPKPSEVVDVMLTRPSVLRRTSRIEAILRAISQFLGRFDRDMGDLDAS